MIKGHDFPDVTLVESSADSLQEVGTNIRKDISTYNTGCRKPEGQKQGGVVSSNI